MGNSSSQPEPDSQHDICPSITSSMMGAYDHSDSPSVDDIAASQQLMSESAGGIHDTTTTLENTTPTEPSRRITRKKSKKTAKTTLAPSDELGGPANGVTMNDAVSPSPTPLATQPARKIHNKRTQKKAHLEAVAPSYTPEPRSSAFADLQTFVQGDTATQQTHVEVPDSQTEAAVESVSSSLPTRHRKAISASINNGAGVINNLRKNHKSRARNSKPVSIPASSQDTPVMSHSSPRSRHTRRLAESTPDEQVNSTPAKDIQEIEFAPVVTLATRKLKAPRTVQTPDVAEEEGSPAYQRRQRRLKKADMFWEATQTGERSLESDSINSTPQEPTEDVPYSAKPKSRRSKNKSVKSTEQPSETVETKSRGRKPRTSEVPDQLEISSEIDESGTQLADPEEEQNNDNQGVNTEEAEEANTEDADVHNLLPTGTPKGGYKLVVGQRAKMPRRKVRKSEDGKRVKTKVEDFSATATAEEPQETLMKWKQQNPKGSTKQSPKGSTKQSPKGSTKQSPKGSTKQSPKGSTKQSHTMSAAEESMLHVRDLDVFDLDIRTNGDFTADEEELIRRTICTYRDSNNLEVSDLVHIIQWTNDSKDRTTIRRSTDFTPADADDARESAEFWDEINQSLLLSGPLTRSLDSVRRHIRSQYHTCKIGGWTEEEDDTVLRLYEKFPRQWKLIAIALDRLNTDVHSRWVEYLQHRDKRKTGRWTANEEARLVSAVTTVAQRDEDARSKEGYLPRDKYTTQDIFWPAVAAEIGHTRGCVQILAKWKKMMGREVPPTINVRFKPRDGHDRPFPQSTPQPRGRARVGSVQETPSTPTVESPGIGKMLWGDKFDLVEAIMIAGDDEEDGVDWEAIATQMKLTWSKRTLQKALRELLATVESSSQAEAEMAFQDKLAAIVEFLADEHGGELGEHYDPAEVDAGVGGDDGSAKHERRKRKSTSQDESRGKDKGRASDGVAESQPASQRKKRKTKAPIPTFRSQEVIEESEEEEGEL